MRMFFSLTLAAPLYFAALTTRPEAKPSTDEVAFFETKVRPIFAEHCFQCHSDKAAKLKGELRLDLPELVLKGGKSGPVLVPGDPEKSLLIKAVRYSDPHLQMPP